MNAIDKRPYELFQRKDSPNWWMRFSITIGTEAAGQAKRGAWRHPSGPRRPRAAKKGLRRD
jgi:hypothetical protein